MSQLLSLIKADLDFLQQWKNDLDQQIHKLSFEDGDIRKDYFRMSYNNVKQYYNSYTSFLTSYLINRELLRPQGGVASIFGQHLMGLKGLTIYDLDMKGYFHAMNHRVYIMAWSLFELSITTIFLHVCPQEEIEKYCNKSFLEIESKIEEAHREKVKKKLTISSPNFIPMPTKYGYLFKHSKGYDGNIKDDKNFLEFFGKFRNTVHSNFIYFGSDYEYRFGQAHFKFKTGESVKWSDPFEKHENMPSVKLYIYLIGRLNEISLKLFDAVKCDDFIEYPDPKAE